VCESAPHLDAIIGMRIAPIHGGQQHATIMRAKRSVSITVVMGITQHNTSSVSTLICAGSTSSPSARKQCSPLGGRPETLHLLSHYGHPKLRGLRYTRRGKGCSTAHQSMLYGQDSLGFG